jgi:hypothetical protein
MLIIHIIYAWSQIAMVPVDQPGGGMRAQRLDRGRAARSAGASAAAPSAFRIGPSGVSLAPLVDGAGIPGEYGRALIA